MTTVFQMNAVLSKFSKNYMDLKRDLPIRPSEMGVLNILANTPGPHTAMMLRNMLGVSKPMIAAHLSVLEKKGYITRQQSMNDKRVFFVFPTDKAMSLVEEVRQTMELQLNAMIRQLGEDRFALLVQLADEANQVMESGALVKETGDDSHE